MTFSGFDPNSKNPANPRKIYTAAYQAPAPAGGMFTNQAPAQPVAQPAAAPATPAPVPAVPDAVRQAVTALIATGQADEQIAATLAGTGLPVTAETVATIRATAA